MLAARLSDGRGGATPAAMPSLKLPKGGIASNIVGIVVAVLMAGVTSNIVNSIVETCVRSGATEAVCRASRVNWAMVYGVNGLAFIIGITSLASLVLARRAGNAGSGPR